MQHEIATESFQTTGRCDSVLAGEVVAHDLKSMIATSFDDSRDRASDARAMTTTYVAPASAAMTATRAAIPGIHCIGESATEIIHIGQAVMHFDGSMDYFRDAVFNYPTMTECYKIAAFNDLNKLDLDKQDADASVDGGEAAILDEMHELVEATQAVGAS